MFETVPELMTTVATRCRAKRLSVNLTQAGLAKRSGVSVASVRLFERSGKISLESLLKIAMALGAEADFSTLFRSADAFEHTTMDALLESKQPRKRGRRT